MLGCSVVSLRWAQNVEICASVVKIRRPLSKLLGLEQAVHLLGLGVRSVSFLLDLVGLVKTSGVVLVGEWHFGVALVVKLFPVKVPV